MRHLLPLVLLISGCVSTPVAVKSPNVLDFPPSLLTECEEGEFISPDKQLSDNVKIMVTNNVKWAECRLSKRILIDSIKMRQEATKAP